MPQITAITSQKKRPNRVSIFLDGDFAFGLKVDSVYENSLKVGKILTSEEIEKILKVEEFAKLQDIVFRFLNYRPRSEKEIRDHLTLKVAQKENVKFSQAKESPLIDSIISKLKKYKFINDLEFAKWFLNSRMRSHQKGLRLISMELKVKGIDQEIIKSITKNAGSEKDLATKAVEKKIKRWQKLSTLDFKKKFYQFLLARGFSYETIKETFAYFAKKR